MDNTEKLIDLELDIAELFRINSDLQYKNFKNPITRDTLSKFNEYLNTVFDKESVIVVYTILTQLKKDKSFELSLIRKIQKLK